MIGKIQYVASRLQTTAKVLGICLAATMITGNTLAEERQPLISVFGSTPVWPSDAELRHQNEILYADQFLYFTLKDALPSYPAPFSTPNLELTTDIKKTCHWKKLQSGLASWYGPTFNHKRTANGELFNQRELTAAHRALPFGLYIRVTNIKNKDQVIVRVNDRGPYMPNRILDLSEAAAEKIDLLSSGTSKVLIEVSDNPDVFHC